MENHSPIQNPSTVAIPLTPGPDAQQIALQDPYILRQIFAHLRVPSLPLSRTPLPESPTIDQTSRFQTRRFLGRAALVCRAFFEPARDALWSSLDSLRPIFNVLNPGWQKRLDESDTVVTFPNLSTFTTLSRKIREIDHHPQSENTPVPSRMVSYCAGRVLKGENVYPDGLFPALRILRCTLNSGRSLEIFRLITPSLNHLALYGIAESTIPIVIELLINLVCITPSLGVLELRGAVKNITFDDILRFKSLTSLAITCQNDEDGVTVKKLQLLGALRCLESIEIDLANWDKTEAPKRTLTSIWTSESIKTLTSVTVSGNPRAILAFMSGINGASLAILHVRIAEGTLNNGALQLYSALKGLGTRSLRSLSIVDQARILPELGSQMIVNTAYHYDVTHKSLVEFLSVFSDLEHLTYDTPRFYLNRSELDRITSMRLPWLGNRLRTFSLPIPLGDSSIPLSWGSYTLPPQINALRTFIFQHPRLEYIQLYLNITLSSIPDPRTFISNSASQLKVLGLGSPTSTMEELDELIHEGAVLRLAGCLDKLFPKLIEIRYNEKSLVQSKLWKLVFKTIEFKRQ